MKICQIQPNIILIFRAQVGRIPLQNFQGTKALEGSA